MRTIIGLERIGKFRHLFAGKGIGLITNFSGVLPDFSQDNIDLMIGEGFRLKKIFTPEHGLYGAKAGEKVESSIHPRYHIPVISLYGDHRTPTEEDLEGIDLLVYDIQDVGLRYYTYIYTMCYSLKKAAEKGIPYVILDRPNPLGGKIVWGPKMEKNLHSFVGDYELPMRYGLTIGEIAEYYLEYTGTKAKLTVVPMENYGVSVTFPYTGLIWNLPSPALPTFESTLCYAGGCLVEAFNISEGRGSSMPFQMYGAPFVDMDLLYEDMKSVWEDESVVFRKRAFIPVASKYKGELCYGLECHPVKENCDFLSFTLLMLRAMIRRNPDKVILRTDPEGEEGNHLTIIYGNDMAGKFLNEEISIGELNMISLKQIVYNENRCHL